MQTQPRSSNFPSIDYAQEALIDGKNDNDLISISEPDDFPAFQKIQLVTTNFEQDAVLSLADMLAKFSQQQSKESFLVFKNNKYTTVPTKSIAFFYVKYEVTMIVCFDLQEYSVNYSVDQIQRLVAAKQFFRINRQYLINFTAIKEVEHYFARKLLVKLTVAAKDEMLISKDKASCFLQWLEKR